MSILIRRLMALSFVVGGTYLVGSFLYSTFSGFALIALSAILLPITFLVMGLLLIPVTLIIFKIITLFTKDSVAESMLKHSFSK